VGQGLAVSAPGRSVALLAVLALLSGCGNDKSEPSPMGAAVGGMAKATLSRVAGKRGGAAAQPAGTAQMSRADIEKFGIPILRVVIKARGADALVTIGDTKGDVVTWATTDGTTFTFRSGVLIQTRGLGPDLMSASVPSVAQLSDVGGSHPRSYFFLGEDDRSERRDYQCSVAVVGKEKIEVFAREHATLHVSEECVRPEGKITNDFWLEGGTVRKSRQWTSPGTGYLETEVVVD
jgi:Group 4 capsule polysaccharide lipoprotein gfcB, YjbF